AMGETARERAASLLAIRDLHRRYHHIQEVIVQNFRAKPKTAMHDAPEPSDETFLAAVAVARIVMGPHVSVQAPPNLSDETQRLRLLDAGINDWGGGSPMHPDHVTPQRPRRRSPPTTSIPSGRGRRSTGSPRRPRHGANSSVSGWRSTRGTRASPIL